MPSFEDLQLRINYRFHDPGLLERALTHKSYANENKVASHNERMEFLGDSVLNLIVSEYLMKACPESSEGELSRRRAAVVSEPALAVVARSVGLGPHILLGRGEEQTGGRNKDSLLADSLEALIAAVYLDGNKPAAEVMVLHLFKRSLRKTCSSAGSLDYKTRLQELCQEQLKQLPEYRIVSESGPDHRKEFAIEVWIKSEVRGRGTGRSKKEAEQKAAHQALDTLAADQPSR